MRPVVRFGSSRRSATVSISVGAAHGVVGSAGALAEPEPEPELGADPAGAVSIEVTPPPQPATRTNKPSERTRRSMRKTVGLATASRIDFMRTRLYRMHLQSAARVG